VLALAEPLADIGEQSGQVALAHGLDPLEAVVDVLGNLFVDAAIEPANRPGDHVALVDFLDIALTDDLRGLDHLAGEGGRFGTLHLGGIENLGAGSLKLLGVYLAID